MRMAKMVLSGFLSAILLALTPAVGSAQDDTRIHFNVGGGPTFQGGDLGNAFSTGWGPAVGVTVEGPNKITLSKDKKTVELENYGIEPVRLTEVRIEK
jgi:hypothetical protein